MTPTLPKSISPITACQARAARAMLALSVRALAENSGVSQSSIVRMEKGFGLPKVSLEMVAKLTSYYEERGFVFTWENERPGVIWAAYPGSEAA